VHRFGALVTSLLVLLGLAGCGDGSERYNTLNELRDAAVASGFECSGWTTTPAPNGWQRGDCSDSVLALFPDKDVRDDAVDALQRMHDIAKTDAYPVLVGENWLINSPQAPDLQDAMGGDVVMID
jgi:hypothetical protein